MCFCVNEVFFIPHCEKYLVHAPLHGVTSLLSADAASELRAALVSGDSVGVSPDLRQLTEALIFVKPAAPYIPTGPFAPRQLGLLPTNDCNMRCKYCAPNAGTSDRSQMDLKTCEAALRYQAEISRREGFSSLMVSYFGGEPFVAWDVVQHCDNIGRHLAEEIGIPFYSTCDTNGFMPEEHARWVARHLTYVVVSLDGPADIHNRYRPSAASEDTHSAITRNLGIFKQEGLPYVLRCSVSSEIVQRLPEIAEYFCAQFCPRMINFDPLVFQGRCVETGLRPPDPGQYVRAVIEAARVLRKYNVGLKLSTVQLERLGQSCCPVSTDHLVVTPDGYATACYSANSARSSHFEEFLLGEVDSAAGTIHIEANRVNLMRSYNVANIPRCRDCFCKWHCSGGCRIFQTRPFSEDPQGPLCEITQKLTQWKLLELLRCYEEADRVSVGPEETVYACA